MKNRKLVPYKDQYGKVHPDKAELKPLEEEEYEEPEREPSSIYES